MMEFVRIFFVSVVDAGTTAGSNVIMMICSIIPVVIIIIGSNSSNSCSDSGSSSKGRSSQSSSTSGSSSNGSSSISSVRPSTYFIKLTFHDFPHAPGPPLPQGLYGVLNGLGRTDKVRIVVGNTGAGMFGRLC